MRAPKITDVVLMFLGGLAFVAVRTFFSPDPPVTCPDGTGCYSASLPKTQDYNDYTTIINGY